MKLACTVQFSWRLVVAGALVWAMLAGQSLGVLHRVVHTPLGSVLVTAAHPSVDGGSLHADHGSGQDDDSHDHKHHTSLTALWSGHQDAGDECRIYDQLSHGDLVAGAATPALSLALPASVLSLLSGLATARWHAAFQARGPPLVR